MVSVRMIRQLVAGVEKDNLFGTVVLRCVPLELTVDWPPIAVSYRHRSLPIISSVSCFLTVLEATSIALRVQ
jgi:hypothetical protein